LHYTAGYNRQQQLIGTLRAEIHSNDLKLRYYHYNLRKLHYPLPQNTLQWLQQYRQININSRLTSPRVKTTGKEVSISISEDEKYFPDYVQSFIVGKWRNEWVGKRYKRFMKRDIFWYFIRKGIGFCAFARGCERNANFRNLAVPKCELHAPLTSISQWMTIEFNVFLYLKKEPKKLNSIIESFDIILI